MFHFLPSAQIEGHLSEEDIYDVFDNFGKLSLKSLAVQVAYPEVLLHDVTLL